MFGSLKNFFADLYHEKGKDVGMYLLKNMGISAIALVAITFMAGSTLSFVGILEIILSIPLISVLVTVIRLALSLVHLIIPRGSIRLILDIIVFGVVIVAAGYFFDQIPLPESNILQTIIVIFFDVLYYALTVFLLLSNRHKDSRT